MKTMRNSGCHFYGLVFGERSERLLMVVLKWNLRGNDSAADNPAIHKIFNIFKIINQ